MNVRSVSEMMSGSERSAEVPAETDRAETLMTESEASIETGEAKAVTAEVHEQTAPATEPEAPQVCVTETPAPAAERAWSPRSRRSIRAEQSLEEDLRRRKAMRAAVEGTLATLREEKARLLKMSIEGEAWAGELLSKNLTNIEAEERKLSVYKEEAEKAQGRLDDFRASVAACAPKRAEIQDKLADVADALVSIDAENQPLLETLYKNLKARAELTGSMRKLAAEIELTYDFEAGIPASFIESLRFDMPAASKAWKVRLVGVTESLRAYVVCDKQFEPEETLARKAIYSFGETVFLSEEEGAPFLRNDRPTPGGREWEYLPPTLMTAEDFAAAKAEAGPLGSLMAYYLSQRHGELNQRRREAWLLERRGTLTPGQRVW